jgi:hypothetical protein
MSATDLSNATPTEVRELLQNAAVGLFSAGFRTVW